MIPEPNTIIQGDALSVLKKFDDESIDCCITSPPYYALRDYGHPDQLGLEPDFRNYISNLCDIFDEIKRVLKKTGTLFINLGDTYAGNKTGYTDTNKNGKVPSGNLVKRTNGTGVPSKCLLQIPSRFAIEMTDNGWILRNKIIWQKPNCMPASVKDRLTVDYEEIFFFVKNKSYYFDAESIAEPITDSSAIRLLQDIENQSGSNRANGGLKTNGNMKAVGRKPFDTSMGGGGNSFMGHSGYRKADGKLMIRPKRNRRCVWYIPTAGFQDAHFAVFPEDLIKPMILAGCPEGG